MSKPTKPPEHKVHVRIPLYQVTAETVHSAVLMLLSEEPTVICQTLRAITKYCMQDEHHREVIYELGALDSFIRLLEYPELNVRRYALKSFAQMCMIPRVAERVLQDENNLKTVLHILARADDAFVAEFSSQALAQLTLKPAGCHQLLAHDGLSTIFPRLKSGEDPDVVNNCIQIITNMLDDPVCSREVCKHPNFSWDSLLALTHNPFLSIQHTALRAVDQLIRRTNDKHVQNSFRDSTGIRDLFDILDVYEFRDVHAKVLRLLRNYVKREENVKHLHEAGCTPRLMRYLEMAIPTMKPHCLSVLTEMSFNPTGRKVLYDTDTDLIFCHQLLTTNMNMVADAAKGISNMTLLVPSAVRICETDVIDALCGLVSDDETAWFDVRLNSLRALASLCRDVPKGAKTMVQPEYFDVIRSVHRNYISTVLVTAQKYRQLRVQKPREKENPIEAQRMAVQCYINLLKFYDTFSTILNLDFMRELLEMLQRIDICLKIMVCTVIAGASCTDTGKKLFAMNRGEEIVDKNLKINHVGLRNALCKMIIATVTDAGAERYLELGTIHYMFENKIARYLVQSWDPALEVLFDHHPAAKFAYRGRLEITDFTKEGFYVMKRLERPLPTLRKILSTPPPHCLPVFVCAMQPHLFAARSEVTFYQDLSDRESEIFMPFIKKPKHNKCISDDPNLREYVYQLRALLGDPRIRLSQGTISSFEMFRSRDNSRRQSMISALLDIDDTELSLIMKRDTIDFRARSHSTKSPYFRMHDLMGNDQCDHVSSSVKEQALLLAAFVQEQMSGLSQEKGCSMPSVDLHLADLMMESCSRVIGLGNVRCGGSLERAILYKVLADRLSIPCALVRNGSGYACCQVALPNLDEDYDKNVHATIPAVFLRPNYVVDLMSRTPKLYPMRSYDASKICGPWHKKPYTSASLIEDDRKYKQDDQLKGF